MTSPNLSKQAEHQEASTQISLAFFLTKRWNSTVTWLLSEPFQLPPRYVSHKSFLQNICKLLLLVFASWTVHPNTIIKEIYHPHTIFLRPHDYVYSITLVMVVVMMSKEPCSLHLSLSWEPGMVNLHLLGERLKRTQIRAGHWKITDPLAVSHHGNNALFFFQE